MITIVTKQSGLAVLVCKLEESQTEPKVIEVGGVIDETGRTVLAENIVNFIFKGRNKVPC